MMFANCCKLFMMSAIMNHGIENYFHKSFNNYYNYSYKHQNQATGENHR